MRTRIFLIFCLLAATSIRAQDYHRQSKVLSETLKTTKPQDLKDVPHYQGQNVPEAQLQAGTIKAAACTKAQQSEEVHLIKESIAKRPPVKLDSENDPLFKPQEIPLNGEKPYCLDGDCVEQAWAPNQDMAESLSKLAIFRHIQKDMSAKTQTVFKGKDMRCSRDLVNFKDCCVKKGWGMTVGLAGCKSEEKELAEHRKLDKCVHVGTYCDKKVLGKCVHKKTSYCCYDSKMARLIHEQGRKQLGLGFGSAKHPQCQGLTFRQLTKIDFAKIDLSELFQDILTKAKPPAVSKPKIVTEVSAHGQY